MALCLSSLSFSQTQISNIYSQSGDQGSSPVDFFEFNNKIYFSAKTENLGREIWVSDINEKKTSLLKDINLGSDDGIFYFDPVILNGFMYFFASDGDSEGELWKSDGTESGTTKITDFLNKVSTKLTVVNNSLFFIVNKSLWKSDGTSTGTLKVMENLPMMNSVSFQTELNNSFIFTIQIENTSSSQLWKSNGTNESTTPISIIADGVGIGGTSNFSHFIKHNNELYFVVRSFNTFGSNSGGIMKTDGTLNGTVPVKGIHPANTDLISYGDVTVLNNKLYFSFLEKNKKRLFIWESDGTETNTKKIYDFDAGSNFFTPSNFITKENSLLFFSGNANGGTSLFEYNTNSEILDEKLEIQGKVTSPFFFVPEYHISYFNKINDNQFFTSYTTNFVLGSGYVLDVANYSFTKYNELGVIGSFSKTIFANNMIFKKSSLENGSEVWLHNFNTNVTELLKNINTSKYGMQDNFKLLNVSNKLVFHAKEVNTGNELWGYNPTNDYLSILNDINPNSGSSIFNALAEDYLKTFIIDNDQLLFSANDGSNGFELWKTDGTPNGTSLLKDLNSDSKSSTPSNFFFFNNNLYFVGYPDKDLPNSFLIRKDGDNFINEVNFGMNEVQTNLANEIEQIVPSQNYIYFKFTAGKIALYRTDGTQQGSIVLKEFWEIGNLVDVNGILYFAAKSNEHQNEVELYKSDGTPEGTILVKNIGVNFSSYPSNLTALNGLLYFTAATSSNGRELWKSDGTEAGTVMIKDILPGSTSSIKEDYFKENNGFITFNNEMYFSASDESNGIELWKSDGTEAGTKIVKNINVGSKNSNPKEFTVVDNLLYFQARDSDHGSELWKSDGTEVGTKIVADVLPGPSDSNPIFITDIGNDLYFKATTENNGIQVFKLQNFKTLSTTSSLDLSDISIFPNPTNSNLFLKSKEKISNLKLYNINGQLIKKYNQEINQLNLDGLEKGIYFLNFTINKKVITKKIVKI